MFASLTFFDNHLSINHKCLIAQNKLIMFRNETGMIHSFLKYVVMKSHLGAYTIWPVLCIFKNFHKNSFTGSGNIKIPIEQRIERYLLEIFWFGHYLSRIVIFKFP